MKCLLDQKVSNMNRFELKKSTELKEDDIIPIVSDVMFKTMLGNESKKKYVSYFLSLVLEKDYKEIYDNIIFLKNELDKNKYNDTKKTVDLIVKIDGVIYNIEMNNNYQKTYIERNIEYITELYKSSRKIGEGYKYEYTYQINIFLFHNHHQC